jgi:hypothetical protein
MRWFAPLLAALLLMRPGAAQEAGGNRVTSSASDQDVSLLLATLGALSGESYEPELDLLASGVSTTRASLVLADAGTASCRQALAFALDCWWADGPAGQITLLTGRHLPQGPLQVQSLGSTLRRQSEVLPLVERLMVPWLGGDAGISLLPSDGLWTATLDGEGQRRLLELLTLLERPAPQVSSHVPDAAQPDPRRFTTAPLRATSWVALMEGIGRVSGISLSLSPLLRLRVFPAGGIELERQPLGSLVQALQAHGVTATWCRGVLCLGEAGRAPELVEREHPGQRRRLAVIPIGHLVSGPFDGELVATALRTRVAPAWWTQPGAGLVHIERFRALLVAADPATQQAVLAALGAIDRLGLELGLQSLGSGRR